jgi:hypothetical protein
LKEKEGEIFIPSIFLIVDSDDSML